MEIPASCMTCAIPMTSSSANAVKTSRRFVFAIVRKSGCVANRPTTTTPRMAPTTFARPAHRKPPPPDPSCAREGNDGDERDRRHVLEEQDPESRLAHRRGEQAALLHRLHRDGRRRQRHGKTGDERAPPGEACRQRPAREDGAAHPHLDRAPTEDALSHGPEAAGIELEPDEKEHEDDAELGEMQDRLDVGHQAQARGTDGAPRREVPEDRAELEAARHGHEEDRRAEVDDRVREHRVVTRHRGVSSRTSASRRAR